MKKYIFASGLAVSIGYLLNEKKRIESIIYNLKPILRAVKNIKIKNGSIIIDLDLSLYNPSDEDLRLYSGFVKIQKLIITDRATNKKLAETVLNVNQISIPSKKGLDLPTIIIYFPMLEAVSMALQYMTSEVDTDKLLERLQYNLQIKYLGVQQIISI